MLRTVTYRYVWNSGETCEEDSDCGSKGDCIDDKCFQTCEDKNDCMYKDQCLNKICQPKCKSHNECPNGDFCKEGHCTLPFCEEKEDCESKPERHAICKNNLCHYIKLDVILTINVLKVGCWVKRNLCQVEEVRIWKNYVGKFSSVYAML